MKRVWGDGDWFYDICAAKPLDTVMHLRFITLTAFSLLVVLWGCASPPPNGYIPPSEPIEELAILDWGGSVWGGSRAPNVTAIDGRPVPVQLVGSEAKITAGPHTIDYSYSIYRGLYAIPSHAYIDRTLTFTAEAGHLYRLYTDCAGLGSSSCWSWIEDKSTETVVAGTLPKWADPDLAMRSDRAENERNRRALFDSQLELVCAGSMSESDIALYFLVGISPIGETDLSMAYAWYSLAESRGDVEAGSVRRELLRDLSEAQIAQAKETAESLRLTVCREEMNEAPAEPILFQGTGDDM